MKSFVFKLKALLRLKENKRDVALSQFAGSVQEVEKLNTKLKEARDRPVSYTHLTLPTILRV